MTDIEILDAIAAHKIQISFVHDGTDHGVRVTAFNPRTGELLGGEQQVGFDVLNTLRKAVIAVVEALRS